MHDNFCSVFDIQSYFEYIIKKQEALTGNPPIQIYTNKFESRVTFKIKTGYYLELFTPETMKLVSSSKKRIIENKDGENIPQISVTEVVLVY